MEFVNGFEGCAISSTIVQPNSSGPTFRAEEHISKARTFKQVGRPTYIASTPIACPLLWTQQHACGVYPNFSILIISSRMLTDIPRVFRVGGISTELTEVDHVEHLRAPILRNARKQLTVGTR